MNAAADLLAGDRGAATAISGALKRLSRMNEDARRAAASAETALDQAYNAVEEARRELEVLQTRLDIEPGSSRRSRIASMTCAPRRANTASRPTRCPGWRPTSATSAMRSAAGSGSVKAAEAAVAAARTAYVLSAAKLTKSRSAAARKLEAAVAGELAPLKLGHAKFRVALEPLAEDAASAAGQERVALEVATVEGAASALWPGSRRVASWRASRSR
ncbi:MAG: hypothetical protein WDN08_18710 [Rhizomicrobium sp.]